MQMCGSVLVMWMSDQGTKAVMQERLDILDGILDVCGFV